MGHSRIRLKVRRRRVAILAAKSRQFDVINHKKKLLTEKVNHKLFCNGDMSKAITCPFTGHKFVPVNPHPIPGKFDITITGYEWVEPEYCLWEPKRNKQPKRLMKYKKRKFTGTKWAQNGVGGSMRVYDTKRQKKNDFVRFFQNYPYKVHRMNHVEYMETLVKYKVEKWEKKNPKPMDMFEQDIKEWEILKNKAEERIRDFVVSVYDKLLLTGRFKINKSGSASYQEKKIAELKDINGEGHKVNELGKDSKLLKKAQDVTNKVHARHPNLVASNLKDHKKQKGRIILPETNMRKAA